MQGVGERRAPAPQEQVQCIRTTDRRRRFIEKRKAMNEVEECRAEADESMQAGLQEREGV
jgi:hypothetical protein